MKKCLVVLFLAITFVPSVALASWWNPISWFGNKQPDQSLIIVASTTAITLSETGTTKTISSFTWWNPISWFRRSETENKQQLHENRPAQIEVNSTSTPIVANEEKPSKAVVEKKNVPVPVSTALVSEKPEQSFFNKIITAVTPTVKQEETHVPVKEEAKIVTTNTVQKTSLEINSVKTTPERNSVLIQWQTNIPTNSKVFIGGSSVTPSESGLSTKHFATIDKLESNKTYTFEIEALADSNVAKYEDSFKTSPDSYEMTLGTSMSRALVNSNVNITLSFTKNGKPYTNTNSVEVTTPDPTQGASGFHDNYTRYEYTVKNTGYNNLTFKIPELGVEKTIAVVGAEIVPIKASIRKGPGNFTIHLKNENPGGVSCGEISGSVNQLGISFRISNMMPVVGSTFKWTFGELQILDDKDIYIGMTIPNTITDKIIVSLGTIEIHTWANGHIISIPVEGDYLTPFEIIPQ